jgi:hypothetical protein
MDPTQKIVPDYNKTAPELFLALVEQFEVDAFGMFVLARQLDLVKKDFRPKVDGESWLDEYDPAVRNALESRLPR